MTVEAASKAMPARETRSASPVSISNGLDRTGWPPATQSFGAQKLCMKCLTLNEKSCNVQMGCDCYIENCFMSSSGTAN